jgi:hypothetical protein
MVAWIRGVTVHATAKRGVEQKLLDAGTCVWVALPQ